MHYDMTTEEGRIARAKDAGYNVARHEALAGHTEPRNWDKDGVQNAGAFSHLAAAGFTRLGARMFSQVFVDAYRQGFAETQREYLQEQNLHSPDKMSNKLEWAINSGPTMSGRVDAIAHVAKLIQGEWTPEYLADVQATNLDDDAEPGYVRGYKEAWNALYGMASGVSIDEVHKV